MSEKKKGPEPRERSKLWKELDAVFGRCPDEKRRPSGPLRRADLVSDSIGTIRVFVPFPAPERSESEDK